MPIPRNASIATPVEKGLTVEPITPDPAPNSTVPTATNVSKPAATMVALNKP